MRRKKERKRRKSQIRDGERTLSNEGMNDDSALSFAFLFPGVIHSLTEGWQGRLMTPDTIIRYASASQSSSAPLALHKPLKERAEERWGARGGGGGGRGGRVENRRCSLVCFGARLGVGPPLTLAARFPSLTHSRDAVPPLFWGFIFLNFFYIYSSDAILFSVLFYSSTSLFIVFFLFLVYVFLFPQSSSFHFCYPDFISFFS